MTLVGTRRGNDILQLDLMIDIKVYLGLLIKRFGKMRVPVIQVGWLMKKLNQVI